MCIKPKKVKEEMFSDAEIYQKMLDCFPNHGFENMERYYGIKEAEIIFFRNGRQVYFSGTVL